MNGISEHVPPQIYRHTFLELRFWESSGSLPSLLCKTRSADVKETAPFAVYLNGRSSLGLLERFPSN